MHSWCCINIVDNTVVSSLSSIFLLTPCIKCANIIISQDITYSNVASNRRRLLSTKFLFTKLTIHIQYITEKVALIRNILLIGIIYY